MTCVPVRAFKFSFVRVCARVSACASVLVCLGGWVGQCVRVRVCVRAGVHVSEHPPSSPRVTPPGPLPPGPTLIYTQRTHLGV